MTTSRNARVTVKRALVGVLAVVLVMGSGLTAGAGAAGQQHYETLFSIPIGDAGVSYELGGAGQQSWGPTAMAVGEDGNVWVADTVANRVLRYSSAGVLLDTIDMPATVVGIGDLEVRGGELFVLDIAAGIPKVLRVDISTGSVAGTYDVPKVYSLPSGLSGIALGERGEVVLELAGGTTLVQLTDADGRLGANEIDGYEIDGRHLRVAGFEVTVREGATDRLVDVPHVAKWGGAVLLSAGTDRFDLVVEEAGLVKGDFVVDQLVRRFGWDGAPLGVARVPLNERLFFIPNGVATGPDGAILALVPRSDRLDVVRLRLTHDIEPILSEQSRALTDSDTVGTESALAGCRSRQSMADTFHPYWNNYKYLSDTNINGSCTGRTTPRYLSTPRYYESVSYDWGGWDTVSGFNGYMSPGTRQAGDITSGGSYSCSRGVDCSGLVSRVWGLSHKYGTSNLADVSVPVTGELKAWDIFLKSGHTALFVMWYGSGMYIGESTTANRYDRVVYRYVPTSWGDPYDVYRYENVCP
ncbi:MAG: hypothetical protein GXP34_02080 [Actinobacteria bacterium]|nr:hypothetical protein [Actinomycetota bacterium]